MVRLLLERWLRDPRQAVTAVAEQVGRECCRLTKRAKDARIAKGTEKPVDKDDRCLQLHRLAHSLRGIGIDDGRG